MSVQPLFLSIKMQEKLISVYLKWILGQTAQTGWIQIREDATNSDLYRRFKQFIGLDLEEDSIRIIVNSSAIPADHLLINDYNIRDGSTVLAVMRLRGS
ncbi:hypothetical protein DPMN_118627 [Dreissena polymorpha]|uniref:Ubiquitin-like domain-containing protein n=1 Tax=Dreissena polymorpha TaxID=45954 RepID=A0A9D4JQE9_DREPO|nr:hypothetical protein DPMN_118627 [Dreissena polymorpha]